MRTASNHLRVLCVVAILVLPLSAGASVVVTQIEKRAFFSLWLLSDHAQQNIAHRQVIADHDVTAVAVFDAESLSGVDVVYISPSIGELELQTAEIDALEAFVRTGGRLIVMADNGDWAKDTAELSDRFGVVYGKSFLQGVITCSVKNFDNPITSGAAGRVEKFSGASPNDNLSSTNEDFEVLGNWSVGPPALGFLRVGAGEVAFFTDMNTFDNDMLGSFDNQTLWTNIFLTDTCDPCDANCDGSADLTDVEPFIDLILGNEEPCQDCAGDTNGDGSIDLSDVEQFIACLLG